MSAYIGQYGDSGASMVLNAGIRAIETAQTEVAFQASSGVDSETFAGMSPTSRNAVVSITPKITQIESDKNNLSAARNRLNVTQAALKNIVGIAQNMATSILDVSRTSAEPTNLVDTSIEANNAIANVGTYLNTSTGESYVFSGRNYRHPPIPHPHRIASSPVAEKIAALMREAVKNNTPTGEVFKQATVLMDQEYTSSNGKGIFSSFLYAQSQQTSVSNNSAAQANAAAQANLLLAQNSQDLIAAGGGDNDMYYGIVATQSMNSQPSTEAGLDQNDLPKASTGSPIKNLFRDLMMIQGMKNAGPSDGQYMRMMHSMHESLIRTSNEIIEMESAVGFKQDAIDQRTNNLNLTESALQVQLSQARDVDPAKLAVKSQGLQLGLKASFMLIAQMRNMSLANYI